MPRVLSFTTSGLTFEVDRAQGGLRCTQVLRPHLLHRKPHARVLLVGGVHNTSHASVFSECQACDGSAVVGHTATPAQKARACFLHQHVCAVCSLPTRYPNVDTARPRNKGQVMHGRITGRQCCNELSIKKASGYIHMYIYMCVCVCVFLWCLTCACKHTLPALLKDDGGRADRRSWMTCYVGQFVACILHYSSVN